jgi:hypothetical protein
MEAMVYNLYLNNFISTAEPEVVAVVQHQAAVEAVGLALLDQVVVVAAVGILPVLLLAVLLVTVVRE